MASPNESDGELLTPDDVRLLSDIGFVAASSSQRDRALQIFQTLTLFRPLKAFPYLGLAMANLNAKKPAEAVQALALGRRVLAAAPQRSAEIDEDYAMLGVFEGIAVQSDQRRTEGQRLIAAALERAPHDGAAARLGKCLLGVDHLSDYRLVDALRSMQAA